MENIIDDYTGLLAAVELYRSTRSAQYREAADRRAANLLGRLTPAGWFRSDASDRPFYHAADAGFPVLALPRSSGFNLVVYIVPVVVVLALGAIVALLLPRWRRRSRAASVPSPGPALSAADAARLDDELARYDR